MSKEANLNGPFVLGIDLGTGGCKVCAVGQDGRLAGSGAAAYPTYTPEPGWAEQNPDDWMPAIAGATAELLDETGIRGEEVAGVALSSASHIAVLLDRQGRPTRNAILWSDQRSREEVEALEAASGDEIFARTSNPVSTTWTLPHLAWIQRHDAEAWRRTERILLSKDFLAYQLARCRTTDPATALSSLLYDANEESWSESLCALVDVTPDMLGEVFPATAVVGSLTGSAASMLRLRANIPVINGTLDSAAETFGAGVARSGEALLRLASAGGIHFVFDRAHPHPRLITYPHPVAPLWFSQAGTSTCATSVTWAIRTFTSDRNASFGDWDEMAAKLRPGSEGLFFHPYLSGERCPHWDPRLRASFVGASLRHGTGHFARAVYEGTALSIRDALGILEEVGPSPTDLTAVGGGTESALWLRIVCDCLGKPLRVAAHANSSYGAALLGLVGLGWFKDAEEVLANVGQSHKEMQPDEDNQAIYDKLFETYREIHARLAPVYHGDVS